MFCTAREDDPISLILRQRFQGCLWFLCRLLKENGDVNETEGNIKNVVGCRVGAPFDSF